MGSKFDVACVEETSVSKIKLEECGRKVVFLNPANDAHHVTRVDGCVIKSGSRADWIVSRAGVGHVIVELKGTDVGHAIQQIEATAAFCTAKSLIDGPVGALIMCRQVPKAMSSLQAATHRLRKKFGVALRVSSSSYEFSLSDLTP